MRLKHVDVKDWRILHHPQWEIRSTCPVVIGENGSGKSSLIELIVSIFNEVFMRLERPVYRGELDGFYINYERVTDDGTLCDVVIESGYAEGSRPRELQISIDGIACSWDNVETIRSVMPANIIIYYAGDTDRLETISNHYLETTLKAIVGNGNDYTLQPLNMPTVRPFIYSDMAHLPISLLSLVVERHDSNTLEKLNIDRASVILRLWLKRPKWADKEGGGILGNGSPLLEGFLKGLMNNAMMVEIPNKKTIELEIDANSIADFLNELGIVKKGVFLFELFDLLQYNGFIDDIDLLWNKNGNERLEHSITADYFSEGEKQMVLTSAMTEFWDMEHCLFLFDEPDTFLHPKWQQRFLPEVMGNLIMSQAIITTHSALMVSSISQDSELFKMDKGVLMRYNSTIYGMDVSDVTKVAMETSPRDSYVAQLLDEAYQDISNRQYEQAKIRVAQLKETGISEFEINKLSSTINRMEILGI